MKALPTILTAAVVSFGVATLAAPAARTPDTHGIGTAVLSAQKPLAAASGPSAVDVNRAQSKQIADLRNAVAQLKRDVVTAEDDAQDALAVTGCVNGAYYIEFNDDGTVMQSEPGAGFAVATLDDECVDGGS